MLRELANISRHQKRKAGERMQGRLLKMLLLFFLSIRQSVCLYVYLSHSISHSLSLSLAK